MHKESTHNYISPALAILGISAFLMAGTVAAQVPVDDAGNPIPTIGNSDDTGNGIDESLSLLTAEELETLVGPVALYPDDLLAIVLPASTYPLEIVQAARFLERLKSDPSLKPDEDWDESVIALLNYPEVVQMMSDDIDWTWKLGEAVVAQQSGLVAAVEAFRDRAYAAGNLKSDEYQTVTRDDGIIEIEPASEETIYVPYYEPERVVYYSPAPVYHYYPNAYPVYYYPYPSGHHFNSGFFWGVTTAFSIGWASDYLHVYHHSYYGHPYYGHTYFGNHYRHRSIYDYNHYYVNNHYRASRNRHGSGDYWRPRNRGGARPGQQRARNHYYSGGQRTDGQRSNGQRRNYGDGRTDGLANSNSVPSSRHSTGNDRTRPNARTRNNNSGQLRNREPIQTVAADRTRSGTGNRSASANAIRPSLEFRQRDGNTYTGTVSRRLVRGEGRSAGPSANPSRNRSGNSDAIRFRTRENSADSRAATGAANRSGSSPRAAANRGQNRAGRLSGNATSNRQPTRSSEQGTSTRRRQAPQVSQPGTRTAQPRAAQNSQPRARAPQRQATRNSQPRRPAAVSRPAPNRPAAVSRPAPSRSASQPTRRSSSSSRPREKSAAQARSSKGSGSSRSSGSSKSRRKRK